VQFCTFDLFEQHGGNYWRPMLYVEGQRSDPVGLRGKQVNLRAHMARALVMHFLKPSVFGNGILPEPTRSPARG
jgi:hypothetical protein